MIPSQLTLADASILLGVSPNTVQSWLKRGELASLAAEDVQHLRRRLDASWDEEGRRVA